MEKVPSAQRHSLPPLYRAPSSWTTRALTAPARLHPRVLPLRSSGRYRAAAPPPPSAVSAGGPCSRLGTPPSGPDFLSDAFLCLRSCPATSGISTHFFYVLLFFFSVICSMFKSKRNLSPLTNGRASTTNAIWKKTYTLRSEIAQ